MSDEVSGRSPGRPEFKPTAAQRQKVMMFVATGMSEVDIGRAIGCDPKTLRKHFGEEMAIGRARKFGENVLRLERMAKKGNVTAAKQLDQMMRLAGADERVRSGTDEPEAPTQEGKKERRQRDAEKVAKGGRYAVPEGPKLAVDNTS